MNPVGLDLVQINPLPLPVRKASPKSRPISPLTSELFVLPTDGKRFLIYAPLRRSAFLGNARVVRVIRSLQEGTYTPELDPGGAVAGLLERLQMLNGGPESAPQNDYTGDPEPLSVTLLLTTACNLRCTYCYASAGDTPLEFMTMDQARNGIDFVLGNAKRKGASGFSVSYHGGGEPTANWKVLTESVEYAHRLASANSMGVDITLTTNGVFSEDKAEWLARRLNGASVSFDGMPEMHDTHRPMADGSASAAVVERNMRIFDRAGFRYGMRMTATADQMSRLADSVEYVLKNFRPTSILIEPLYQMGRGTNQDNAESVEFIEAYREAKRRAVEMGRVVEFSGARVGIITKHFCGIAQDNFCISPKGNVTACYESFSENTTWAHKFFYGKPTGRPGEYFFDMDVLKGLREQTVDNRPFCDGCFAKWTCGGDCYHKSLAAHGDGEFQGAGRCNVIRELTKDMVLEKIAASGGLFWHEPIGSNHGCQHHH